MIANGDKEYAFNDAAKTVNRAKIIQNKPNKQAFAEAAKSEKIDKHSPI